MKLPRIEFDDSADCLEGVEIWGTGIVTDRGDSLPEGEPDSPRPNPRAKPEAVISFLGPLEGEIGDGLELLGGVAAKLVEKNALDRELGV